MGMGISYLIIFLFFFLLAFYLGKPSKESSSGPCNQRGLPHDWEYKAVELQDGKIFHFIVCNRCNNRPGNF